MKPHPVSAVFVNKRRLNMEIRRLWARVVGHSHLGLVLQVVRVSIIVGAKIFSIVVGLDF